MWLRAHWRRYCTPTIQLSKWTFDSTASKLEALTLQKDKKCIQCSIPKLKCKNIGHSVHSVEVCLANRDYLLEDALFQLVSMQAFVDTWRRLLKLWCLCIIGRNECFAVQPHRHALVQKSMGMVVNTLVVKGVGNMSATGYKSYLLGYKYTRMMNSGVILGSFAREFVECLRGKLCANHA